jgi:hypothetical protein
MRVYKSRNDVPDDKTELVNKSDMVKRLEDILIMCGVDSKLGATEMDRLLNDLNK